MTVNAVCFCAGEEERVDEEEEEDVMEEECRVEEDEEETGKVHTDCSCWYSLLRVRMGIDMSVLHFDIPLLEHLLVSESGHLFCRRRPCNNSRLRRRRYFFFFFIKWRETEEHVVCFTQRTQVGDLTSC